MKIEIQAAEARVAGTKEQIRERENMKLQFEKSLAE
jgi:hypothetical protein